MLIVSLTSWPKRIGNVATVLKSYLKQDLTPDIIQLNLSKDEFKNREDDFPDDLKELLASEPKIDVEWVDGNDGVFKKIIPTLKKHYGEDYLLLSADDDWIYRKDFSKLMVEYLEKYNSDTFCMGNSTVIGNRVIYKSSVFEPDFWEKLTKDVIDTRIDDSYIQHYLKCKGRKTAYFQPNDFSSMRKQFNPISPNSHNTVSGQYSSEDIRRANNIISAIKFE